VLGWGRGKPLRVNALPVHSHSHRLCCDIRPLTFIASPCTQQKHRSVPVSTYIGMRTHGPARPLSVPALGTRPHFICHSMHFDPRSALKMRPDVPPCFALYLQPLSQNYLNPELPLWNKTPTPFRCRSRETARRDFSVIRYPRGQQ
jgi:hypothetical protein